MIVFGTPDKLLKKEKKKKTEVVKKASNVETIKDVSKVKPKELPKRDKTELYKSYDKKIQEINTLRKQNNEDKKEINLHKNANDFRKTNLLNKKEDNKKSLIYAPKMSKEEVKKYKEAKKKETESSNAFQEYNKKALKQAKKDLNKDEYKTFRILSGNATVGDKISSDLRNLVPEKWAKGSIDAPMQEARDAAQKGETTNKNALQLAGDTVTSYLTNMGGLGNPGEALDRIYNDLKGTFKDKNKTLKQKLTAIPLTIVSDTLDEPYQAYKNAISTYSKIQKDKNNKLVSKDIENFQNTIDKPFNEFTEKTQKENSLYTPENYGVRQWAYNNVVDPFGEQIPSVIATAVTRNPNVSLAMMGLSTKGNATQEALDKGATLDEALKIGNTKAAIEVGTEKMTGGTKIFGKGAVDDIVDNTLNKYVKNKVANFVIKKFGVEPAGEVVEEITSDLLGNLIDSGTVDPNAKYTMKDLENTTLSTYITTLLLNLVGGGYTPNSYRQNAQQLNQVQNIINQKNAGNLTAQQANEMIKQVQNGTYLQNQNIDKIAQEKANEIQSNPNLSQGQKADMINAVTQTLEQQRANINSSTQISQNNESLEQNNAINQEAQKTAKNSSTKQKQFDIIQKTNPMNDEYHTGIRNVNDIKTFEETINDEDSFNWGDFTREDAKKALKTGEIKIYSSKDIKNGAFVSTSYQQAYEYAGRDASKVKSKIVPLENIAWINGDEGQYAKVESNKSNAKDNNLNYKYRVTDKTKSGKDVFNVFPPTKKGTKPKLKSVEGKISTIDNIKVGTYYEDQMDKYVTVDLETGLKISDGKTQKSSINNADKTIKEKNSEGFDWNKTRENWFERLKISKEDISNKDYLDIDTNVPIEEMVKEAKSIEELDRIEKIYEEDAANIEDLEEFQNRSEEILDAIEKREIGLQNNDSIDKNTSESNSTRISESSNEDSSNINQGTSDSSFSNETIAEEKPEILDETPKANDTKLFNALKEFSNKIRRGITDKGQAFYDLAKKTGNWSLYHKYDGIATAKGEAQYNIGDYQTDLNGKKYNNFINKEGKNVSMSLNDIWEDVKNSGISIKDMNTYLVNQLNLDRLNQGVDQFNIPADESVDIIKELEKKHPEIQRTSKNIWQYQRNQLQKMVDGGLISQEQANEFLKNTPHYVRIQRNINKSSSGIDNNFGKLSINNQIKKVKGSTADILPIRESMAQYTINVTNAIRKNQFGIELSKTLGTNDSDTFALDNDLEINPELLSKDKDGYTLTIFEDGKAKTMTIDEGMYYALNDQKSALEIHADAIGKIPRAISSMQRTLLTDKNPLFMATNFFKDIGDAPWNSKYGMTSFAKNYPRAASQAMRNGGYNQLYEAMGISQSSYFNQGEFVEETKGKVRKTLDKVLTPIEKGNEYIEKLPRLTEFITTIEKNGYTVTKDGEIVPAKGKKQLKSIENTLSEAKYNAAEITTNFKRGGNVAKTLNRNGFTFLNASIQGFSKQVRNFTEVQNPKQAVKLLTKAAILGILPAALNDAMYGDDDEYEELPDYIKDQYYLFKGEDNEWIRIPKGRAMATLGAAYRRTQAMRNGKEDAFNGYLEEASDLIAPNNPLDNNVFSPLSAVSRNRSWSGNKIVNDSLSKLPAAEQYDAKTSSISKWLGEKLNYSPKKIDYLINQYTGGIGDFVLPMTTPQAESSSSNPFIAPIKDKFTTDAVMKSDLPNRFYNSLNEAQTQKNSINATNVDKAKYKHLSTAREEMSELYKQQREIQADEALTNKEKYAKAKEIQKEINAIAKESVKDSKDIEEKENYIEVGNSIYQKGYYQGKETIFEETDKNKKNRTIADSTGIPLVDFYKYSSEINKIKADKNKYGKTITNSRKKKVINYINNLPLTRTQKAVMLKKNYSGYKAQDSDIINSIKNSNLSYEEKKAALEALNIKVK